VVLLKEKIPVYIEYHLAGTDVNGEIEFYRNIYKKDLQLLAALNKNQNS
jgi:murein L,D-transpeptidase YcbB/YkuD